MGGNDPTLSMVDEAMNKVEHKSQVLSQLHNVYASLLLVHQRLVGLGRRINRSYCEAEPGPGLGGGRGGEQQQSQGGGRRKTMTTMSMTIGGCSQGEVPLVVAIDIKQYNRCHCRDNGNGECNHGGLPPPPGVPAPLPPALMQHGDYANVAYLKHLAPSGMELDHRRTGKGMQHKAAIKRVGITARMRRMEEE